MKHPSVDFIYEIWPFDLLTPFWLRWFFDIMFFFFKIFWFIPVQIFNIIPNTLSIIAFVMLGVSNLILFGINTFDFIAWPFNILIYFWSFPDIDLIAMVTVLVIGFIIFVSEMTGGTFDFELIGPDGWLCDASAETYDEENSGCWLIVK